MTLDQIFIDSRDRCVKDPQFIPAFYHHLFKSSPEIEKFFTTIDMNRQQEMLKAALYELVDFENLTPDKMEYWLNLSHIHHDLDIRQAHYDSWKQCLLASVEMHDPQFDEKVEQAWRLKLDQITSLMTLIY